MAKPTKLKCTCCGKEKAPTRDFYLSHSDLYKSNEGRMTICKDCFYDRYNKYVVKYDDEVKALYHLCMNFDIYFNDKLVEAAYGQSNRGNDKNSLIKTYITKVNSMLQYKGKGSFESDYIVLDVNAVNEIEEKYLDIIEEYKNSKVVDEEDYDFDSIKIPGHVKKRWGSGYTNEEYLYLEDNYMEFYDTYSHETPAEKMLLMNISRSLLEGERSRKAGKIKDYENMMKLVSSMLTDANIKPSQKKNKGDEIGECFGVFIENIEKNEPIGEAIDEFEDADGIGKLFERQFVRNFARVFGLVGDNDENED